MFKVPARYICGSDPCNGALCQPEPTARCLVDHTCKPIFVNSLDMRMKECTGAFSTRQPSYTDPVRNYRWTGNKSRSTGTAEHYLRLGGGTVSDSILGGGGHKTLFHTNSL